MSSSYPYPPDLICRFESTWHDPCTKSSATRTSYRSHVAPIIDTARTQASATMQNVARMHGKSLRDNGRLLTRHPAQHRTPQNAGLQATPIKYEFMMMGKTAASA